MYFRMEDDNFKKRFKNGLRIEILGDIAYTEYPRSRPKKSYTLKLTQADDCRIIDRTPVNDTRQKARLEFVSADGRCRVFQQVSDNLCTISCPTFANELCGGPPD